MKEAKAFAPGNISCIFSIYEHRNPEKKGSLGLGFTVDKGVTVTVKKSDKDKILFNNKKIRFDTVQSVINKLNIKKKRLTINIRSPLPISSGFGISGAVALATSYALNKLLDLRKTKLQLAKISHLAEVENGTGLGDVVNQYFGGFLLKEKPSSRFIVKKLRIKSKIYYRVFSKIDTKKIITDIKKKEKINKAGMKALKNIKRLKTKNLKDMIKISKRFSIESSLLDNKRIINIINQIENNDGNASMIMLGNAVFSDKRFKGCKELTINDKGAYLI